jgi:hypothetical protein
MYFKVAFIFIVAAFFSGCSFTNALKPKAPNVENNFTAIADDNSTIIPLEESKIEEKKQNKYNLKPEPFSLENNEEDPELLGPQTTLTRGLEKDENEPKESKKTTKNATTKKEKSI